MQFVALDVETANPNMASICQIGLVKFRNGMEIESESIIVNPQTWFDAYNIQIHGIDEKAVEGAKTFPEIHETIKSWTAGETVVCHTHFDRVSLAQACQQYRIDSLDCHWLDSARVTRRTWPQFAQQGYGLANVAAHCGISFEHHDALHDARTAGLILLRAIAETGRDLSEWLHIVNRPIAGKADPIRRTGDGDGALMGEVVVFTGALFLPRTQAANLAAASGADVHPGVTKKTTLLVVGDQDIAKLNGHEKSGKHMKAETLIAAGQPIRIIGETDFMALAAITE